MAKPQDGFAELPQALSEERARRVLERAIEIDQSIQQQMSLERLRTVAKEVGVSDAALAAALRESGQIEERESAPGGGSSWFRRLAGWFSRARGSRGASEKRYATPGQLLAALVVAVLAAGWNMVPLGFVSVSVAAALSVLFVALRPWRLSLRAAVTLNYAFWMVHSVATWLLLFGDAAGLHVVPMILRAVIMATVLSLMGALVGSVPGIITRLRSGPPSGGSAPGPEKKRRDDETRSDSGWTFFLGLAR